ncbi:alpha/beta hydrolase, partial [Leptospira meyeri]
GKDVMELERTTPHVKAVLFSECGHFVHMEKQKAAEKVMKDFLLMKKSSTTKKSFF